MVEFDLELTETPLTRWIDPAPFVPGDPKRRAERCELILKMQADGLAKRLEHAHAKTAVIGISGGLDSCLALLVAVRAMKQLGRPASDVLAVTMPCFGTTHRTRSNAEILCDELQVSFKEIDIAETVHSHFRDIGQDESVLDVTFENGQARVRTLELMDTANRTGGLVVGTGDLSELALGWATYNGDHMSMYGVNAGVPKTLVRHLVHYEADIAATDACAPCCWTFWTLRSPRSCCPPRTARSRKRPRIWWAPMSCTTFTSIRCCASALARPRSSGWQRPPLQAAPNTPTTCCTSGCATSTGGSSPSSSSAAACRTAPRWAA